VNLKLVNVLEILAAVYKATFHVGNDITIFLLTLLFKIWFNELTNVKVLPPDVGPIINNDLLSFIS